MFRLRRYGDDMSRFVTRFAPSSTGYLHLGHAASAFAVWDAAMAASGTVLLRMEDIDETRCRPEYERAIVEDLRWLGLDWPEPVRRQSDHFGEYQSVLDELKSRGLVYRCFRTRSEILAEIGHAPHDAPVAWVGSPLDPAEEVDRVEAGEPFAWRLSMARCRDELGPDFSALAFVEEGGGKLREVRASPEAFGDVILARKDTPSSYHLSVCHDDALQGISHVIRGEDLMSATSVHVLLQRLMRWPTPVYRHHGLLLDETGKRFAKRDRSKTLRALRQDGVTPTDIRRMTGPAL